jgi:hypothetical protein
MSGDDSRLVSRSMDASPQPVVIGEEPQRAVVSDVIAHLVHRGHSDERVSQFAQSYLAALENYAKTPRRERHVASYECFAGTLILSDLDVQRGRKLLNDLLYAVMSERREDITIAPLAIYVLATAIGTTMEYTFSPYIDTASIDFFGPHELRGCSRLALFGTPAFLTDRAAQFVKRQAKKHRHLAERCVSMLTQLRACMHVLASSPIMVDTGQLVPKYQLRTVSDQQNYIANSLTQQPPFHARVKTLHGEFTIRLTPPHEPMRDGLVHERIRSIKQRMRERGVTRPATDVAEEVRKRHELLREQANDAPPARSSTNTRRVRPRPRRDDIEER